MNTQQWLEKLITYPSITPEDKGCQEEMIRFLTAIGFECFRYDNPPVTNFFARFGNHQGPLMLFAGHTDVVPVGDIKAWHSEPFVLKQIDDLLYGRGVADMKGSLACMLVAAEAFVNNHPNPKGQLGFLITSGEEGDHFHLGTPYVMEQLSQLGIHPKYCIVGEPSSSQSVGDVIKIGRRGSLTGKAIVHGTQGHVAYPHLALNPIHVLSPALTELTSIKWDEGNEYFPPTSLQITHIHAGGEANNVIPGELTLHFNFRFSTEQDAESLKAQVQSCFEKYDVDASIEWRLNGEPFLTDKGKLLETCIDVIDETTGKKPTLSTAGGTSDGRFIAPYDVEVIELGPVNATIHQINECVSASDLNHLAQIYYDICEKLLG